MPKTKLEHRVAAIERQLADLESAVKSTQQKKDWRRTIGIFTGDDGMQEIFQAAMKLREADRRKVRKTPRKPRTGK